MVEKKKSLFASNLGESRVKARELIREKLDDASYQDFMDALTNRSISVSAIMEGLTACGVELSQGPIQKWREELARDGK